MINRYIVSKDDSIYEGWPDVVLTKTGKMICIFTECVHHHDRHKSRLVTTTSMDKGRTWSSKVNFTELTSSESWFYNNARISQMSDGQLVVVCDLVYKDENDNIADVYMWTSDDDGITWSKPIKTPAKGIVPDKYLELKCGRRILAAHFKNDVTQKLEQYMWYTDDKGKTWSERIIIASDERYNLCEVSILELTDETLVAFMRENSNLGYDCFKAISNDHGETWHGVYNCPMPGCHRPVSGFLSDGSVMITYRFVQGGGHSAHNVFAAFMDENSAKQTDRQKQVVRIMPIGYDRSKSSDTGYTGWVQFDNGEIYIVNYIMDDAINNQIVAYTLNKEDVFV